MPDAVGLARGGVVGSGPETSLPGPWGGGADSIPQSKGAGTGVSPTVHTRGCKPPKDPSACKDGAGNLDPAQRKSPALRHAQGGFIW